MMHEFVVWLIESLGNADDGFEANDRRRIGIVMLEDACDNEAVVEALKSAGMLDASAESGDLMIEGDEDMITVDDATTNQPLFTLERN